MYTYSVSVYVCDVSTLICNVHIHIYIYIYKWILEQDETPCKKSQFTSTPQQGAAADPRVAPAGLGF